MTEYGGPVTDEKLTALENERTEIEEILSAYEGMGQDYVNGHITKEEYTAYLERHEAAGNRSEFLRKTEERRDYLVSLREEGREGWFLYDTGWKKLTCADPDYFLYAAILLLCAGIFAVEYSRDDTREGFIRILRSTGNGHAQTFFVKLSVAVAAAVILSLLFTVIDVSVAAYYYELPNFAAPLRSIEIFYSMKGSLSVGGYLTVMTAIRCFASVDTADKKMKLHTGHIRNDHFIPDIHPVKKVKLAGLILASHHQCSVVQTAPETAGILADRTGIPMMCHGKGASVIRKTDSGGEFLAIQLKHR